MSHSSCLSRLITLTLGLLLFAGCADMHSSFDNKNKDGSVQADKAQPADPPSQYPGWAYDAPGYMRPAAEVPAEPQAKPTDPLHFFTREKIVSIKRPGGYSPEEAPRVAIYWTDNNGFRWNKAGYFGRDQGFFPLHVEEDGDYGVRFVGPGQEPAKESPAYPERVYHVDTFPPEVEVSIEPEQTWYTPGQSVTVAWNARDYHLIESPVSVYMLLDMKGNESRPVELKRDLSNEGTYTYEIPNETLDKAIRFRVEALDRAANIGVGTSLALQIVNETPSESGDDSSDLIAQRKYGAELSNVPRQLATLTEPDKTAPVYSTAVVESGRNIPDNSIAQQLRDSERLVQPADLVEEDQDEVAQADSVVEPQPKSNSNKKKDTADDKIAELPKPSPKHITFPSLESLARHVLTSESSLQPAREQTLDTMPVQSAIAPPAEAEDEPVVEGESSAESAPQVAIDDEPITRTPIEETRIADTTEVLLDPLVVPFPATLDTPPGEAHRPVVHPWRLLGNAIATSKKFVWSLPSLNEERLQQIFERKTQNDDSPVSMAPESTEILVGEPGETPDPPDMP